jgi:hypothetical protein
MVSAATATTTKMTPLERMRATFRGEPTDRPWRLESIGFWPETIERWHGEGLPFWVRGPITGYLYFNYDPYLLLQVGADLHPNFHPIFPKKVLEERGARQVIQDINGNVVEVIKGQSSIPKTLSSPVRTMDDFQKLRWRLDPAAPGRLEDPLSKLIKLVARTLPYPLGIIVCGIFGTGRHLLGVENLMYTYHDDPELLHAIARQWSVLCRGVIDRVVRTHRLTFMQFWEDMCYKNGPLISPRYFKEFMSPYYREVIDHARTRGVEDFVVDTDGDCTLLIPLFMDAGVNALMPFEVQAGMDIRVVRERFGRRPVIFGGLDKRELAKGRPAIERLVQETALPLYRDGGYVPGIDHAVPPDVPLADFKYFVGLMREMRS